MYSKFNNLINDNLVLLLYNINKYFYNAACTRIFSVPYFQFIRLIFIHVCVLVFVVFYYIFMIVIFEFKDCFLVIFVTIFTEGNFCFTPCLSILIIKFVCFCIRNVYRCKFPNKYYLNFFYFSFTETSCTLKNIP